jgi:integrase
MAGWKKRVLARGGSRSSYNRNATALRAALNLALKRRVVSSDHAWVDELAPFENADGRRKLYLPLRSRRKLVGNTAGEAQSLVRAFALLPLRPGDVAALKISDFDARHAVLSVPRGKTTSRKLPLSGGTAGAREGVCQGQRPGGFPVLPPRRPAVEKGGLAGRDQ